MIKKIKPISIIVALALIILACQKLRDDAVYPRIILVNNPMKYIQGCVWVEPLADSVIDDKPGPKLISSGLPNTDSTGEFYVDYIAIDSDGNQVSSRRVVNIAPLDSSEVIGEYQVVDKIKPIGPTKNYQSTVSIFSQSPLLLKINNLNENYEAFLTFDSTGYLYIKYNINDTLKAGEGRFSCDKTFFTLSYYIDSSNVVEEHKATFTKVN